MDMTILQRVHKLAEGGKLDGNLDGYADAVRRILDWLATDDDAVTKCLGITRVLNKIPNDEKRASVLALVDALMNG